MQNPYVKYCKTAQTFALFYMQNNSIYCRTQTLDGWCTPYCVAEGVTSFSVCYYDAYIYLLYPTTDGRLILSASMDFIQWQECPLWQSTNNQRWQNTDFFIIPKKDTFHVIYAKTKDINGISILHHTNFQKGQWQSPYQIDHFLPMAGTPFQARRLQENHIILYYRQQRNIISAREILLQPFTLGSITPLIQTNAPCIDFSILEDSERLHLLYAVRSLFRTQIIYRYKQVHSISQPIILWEGNSCENCLLYRENGNLVAFWTSCGQPMRCVCQNGHTFGVVEQYTAPFPMQSMKAELICDTTQTDFFATELLGDKQNHFLPSLFYFTPKEPSLRTASNNNMFSMPEQPQQTPNPKEQDEVNELKQLLAQRTEEISTVNAQWQSKVTQLEQQLATLQSQQPKEEQHS